MVSRTGPTYFHITATDSRTVPISAAHCFEIEVLLFILAKQAEEFPQGVGRLPDHVGHQLGALARQVAQLPLDLQIELAAGGDPTKTVIKLVQKTSRFGLDLQSGPGVHTDDLPIELPSLSDHRIAAGFP